MSLRRVRGFGYVVRGWGGRYDYDYSGLLETRAGAELYLEHLLKQGVPYAWVARAEDPSRAEVIEGDAMASRIYAVEVGAQEASEKTVRMVRAVNPSQAVRYVAKNMISAKLASQDDLVQLASKGVKVEEAGETE
jgi:hypothetical protein